MAAKDNKNGLVMLCICAIAMFLRNRVINKKKVIERLTATESKI